MCTAISFKTKSRYFGRNLDLEYRFGEKVVITPRGYEFALKNGDPFRTVYAMMGIAAVVDNYPLYAEAANEKGLAIAALNFPNNAKYCYPKSGALNLAQYELFPYFLGKYATVEEVRPIFKKLNITCIPFAEGIPPSPLHWIISDGIDSIVVEQTESGLKVYDNPIGVLTNNPPFDYHLANINNYMNLSTHSGENSFCDKLQLKAYGGGMGAIGLPGDTSSASRFVRATFNKWNSNCGDSEECSVSQFFHILDSVSMIKGSTYMLNGQSENTVYSCCINLDTGTYYYKTYDGHGITAVRLTETEKNAKELTVFELNENLEFKYMN
ncbi:MAG: choloylglycine hydrolase [Clostridiales bacterium]|nr:choloylglycine hydrolase [Clostridiales bacterium]